MAPFLFLHSSPFSDIFLSVDASLFSGLTCFILFLPQTFLTYPQ